MKTAEIIESAKDQPENTADNKPARKSPGDYIAPWRWKPGQSGNPGGRPKRDLAQVIARAVFEKNPELIYQAYAKLLAKGSAYGFQVVSDRAYGKLKESVEVTNVYKELSDADINQRITELLTDLGLAGQIDEAGRIEVAAGGTAAQSTNAKDSELLSRLRPTKKRAVSKAR